MGSSAERVWLTSAGRSSPTDIPHRSSALRASSLNSLSCRTALAEACRGYGRRVSRRNYLQTFCLVCLAAVCFVRAEGVLRLKFRIPVEASQCWEKSLRGPVVRSRAAKSAKSVTLPDSAPLGQRRTTEIRGQNGFDCTNGIEPFRGTGIL